MSPFEEQIWRELEGQLCDVPLTVLDFATRQGIVDRLTPRIAAAMEEAVSAAFQDVNGSPHKTWRAEAVAALGR